MSQAPARRLAHELLVEQQQEIAVMRVAIPAVGPSAFGAGAAEMFAGGHRGSPLVAALSLASPRPLLAHAPRRLRTAIRPQDRIYTAAQFSNRVSVVNALTSRLLGVIKTRVNPRLERLPTAVEPRQLGPVMGTRGPRLRRVVRSTRRGA